MSTGRDEATAWADALAGDGRAFSSLFDLHYDRVFRHVIGLLDQPADADEVCGAAFVELWRHRARVRVVHGSVLPWLLVTAGNLARNHGRTTNRYRRALRDLPRDIDGTDASAVVEERDELDRRSAALHSALRSLKPFDAQLIALTTRAEMPIQEAAAALGITPGTARVRLHRARIRLREVLATELDPMHPSREGR